MVPLWVPSESSCPPPNRCLSFPVCPADIPMSVGIIDPRANPTQLNTVEFLWDPSKRTSVFIQVPAAAVEGGQISFPGGKKTLCLTWSSGRAARRCRGTGMSHSPAPASGSAGGRRHRLRSPPIP